MMLGLCAAVLGGFAVWRIAGPTAAADDGLAIGLASILLTKD